MAELDTIVGSNAAFVFSDTDVLGFADYQPPLQGSTQGVPQPTGVDAAVGSMDSVSSAAAAKLLRHPGDHPLLWSSVLVALGFIGLAVAAGMGGEGD